MEKNTPKTSANSSKPCSRSEKDESALSHPGSHTKGTAYDPSRSANTRTVETVAVSKVSSCEECGEDLRKVPPRGHERRTQIDIVFEKVVSHVDAEVKSCPHCASETRAPFPESFSGPVQYGSGIKAYALNLLIAQMISLKRVQHAIQSLIGLAISEATILKYVLQLHLALERWEQMAIDRLLTQPAMHVDESVPRTRGRGALRCCGEDEGQVPRGRLSEGDLKPPTAAVSKRHGGERVGKAAARPRQVCIKEMSVSEPLVDVSKIARCCRNQCHFVPLG